MNLKDSLDKFAKTLIDKASQANTPLPESTDAFKAVTTYYAAQQRVRKPLEASEPDEPDGFTFESESRNGAAEKVRARRSS